LTPEALAAGRCLVCGAPTPEPLSVTDDTRQAGALLAGPPSPNQPPERGAVWPTPQASQSAQTSSGGFLRALGLGLGAALAAVLVAALLVVFLQHSFQITLAPFSSSNSSANADSSSQSSSGAQATLTATTTQGRALTPTARSSGATPTAATTPTSNAPTATTVPATLSVQPTSITLSTCVAAQTQFTVRNTGGAPLSWSATASVTSYGFSPASGTLNGGDQQVVTVSGILLSGTITVTAPGARQSPQQVSVTCQL
jgi:cytoskeletal protein RodZ